MKGRFIMSKCFTYVTQASLDTQSGLYFPYLLIRSVIFRELDIIFLAKIKYRQLFVLQVKVINRFSANYDRRLLYYCSLCMRKHESYKQIIRKLLIYNQCGELPTNVKNGG